jgi:ribosomal protein S18 acetylase RimI-like enzyme
MTELDRVRALTRAVAEAEAERVLPVRWGTVLLTPGLPQVWDLNLLRAERLPRRLAAHRIARAADRALGGAGLGHRSIVVDDEELGDRLRPGLTARRWRVEELLVMILRGRPDRPRPEADVRPITEHELRPARDRYLRTAPYSRDPDTRRQLLAEGSRAERAPGLQRLGAYVDGDVAAWCRLYAAGGTAEIDDVVTLAEHRNRGLARAVVLAAAERARNEGADLVFLRADAADWPRRLYERLGFAIAGRHYVFRLTGQPR